MSDKMKFNLEVDCKSVDDFVFQMAKLIAEDTAASPRERQLAAIVIVLGKTLNQLVSDLHYGTATLQVSERDIRFLDR